MEKQMISTTSYSHPEIEERITNLEHELKDFAQIQAKEDAMKEHELTQSLFIIKIKDHIGSKVQIIIDVIRNLLLPTSLVFSAAEIDQAARKKIQLKTNEKHDKLQHRASLQRKLAAIFIDPLKKKYGKWLLLATILVGAGDAALAYSSFRYGGYPILMAFLSAVAIGAVISVSHLLYAGWIKRAGTVWQRTGRIMLILVIGFVFFAWIGNLRAEAANSTVSIALNGNTVSARSSPHLNGWAVAVISFILFVAILFLSLLFWRSKRERLEQEEYHKLEKDIVVIESEISMLEKEVADIERTATVQKSEARTVYDYATSSIRKAKGIGRNAIILYKQTYARFHDDVVPAFFSDSTEPTYDESFQFIKPVKTEPI